MFQKEGDYLAFVRLMGQACERLPLRVVGWCLMPNHFHLVLWPHGDGDLSRWMQWLLTAHVRRYHRHYGGSGHVWQGRFKAFPIQEDEHLLAVLRYVERNALRANLVSRAQDWPYSSLALPGEDWPTLDPGPVPRDPPVILSSVLSEITSFAGGPERFSFRAAQPWEVARRDCRSDDGGMSDRGVAVAGGPSRVAERWEASHSAV